MCGRVDQGDTHGPGFALIKRPGGCLEGTQQGPGDRKEESGTSQGGQRLERTFCVIPFIASSRTGSTNLWGEKPDVELGVWHALALVAVPWGPELHQAAHVSRACAFPEGGQNGLCVHLASASLISYYVVTAASCLRDPSREKPPSPPPGRLRVLRRA